MFVHNTFGPESHSGLCLNFDSLQNHKHLISPKKDSLSNFSECVNHAIAIGEFQNTSNSTTFTKEVTFAELK